MDSAPADRETPRATESGEAPACHKSEVPRVLQV